MAHKLCGSPKLHGYSTQRDPSVLKGPLICSISLRQLAPCTHFATPLCMQMAPPRGDYTSHVWVQAP